MIVILFTGRKRYMDKKALEKSYQQGIELIQEYVTDYLVENYEDIKKIEWQGIGIEYRHSPIFGPSLFGDYVDTDAKVYVSKGNYFTMTFQLSDEAEYNTNLKKYVLVESLNSKWIDRIFNTELNNTVKGGKKGDRMDKLSAEKLKKSSQGSSSAKITYSLKIHELNY